MGVSKAPALSGYLVGATLVFCALICVSAPASADLGTETYHLTMCGGFNAPQPGSPCFVHNQDGPPPASAATFAGPCA